MRIAGESDFVPAHRPRVEKQEPARQRFAHARSELTLAGMTRNTEAVYRKLLARASSQ